jgi:hypothetical protein
MRGVKPMGRYRWQESDFIAEVAARRGCRLDGDGGSGWRLTAPGWTVTLTPASGESPPDIRFHCPGLRASTDDPARQLVVRRAEGGPGSSLGDVEGGAAGIALAGAVVALSGLFRRRARSEQSPAEPPGVLGPRWAVRDPSGVLDAGLAPWFDKWPIAWWGPGDERPARLESLWLNQYGLEVRAGEWWCSAPALDQLIALGLEIAGRLHRAGF